MTFKRHPWRISTQWSVISLPYLQVSWGRQGGWNRSMWLAWMMRKNSCSCEPIHQLWLPQIFSLLISSKLTSYLKWIPSLNSKNSSFSDYERLSLPIASRSLFHRALKNCLFSLGWWFTHNAVACITCKEEVFLHLISSPFLPFHLWGFIEYSMLMNRILKNTQLVENLENYRNESLKTNSTTNKNTSVRN